MMHDVRRTTRVMALAAGLGFALVAGVGMTPAQAIGLAPGSYVRVDSTDSGAPPPAGAVTRGISAGGREVLWGTEVSDVTPGVDATEFFLTDTLTNSVRVVSVDAAGHPLTGRQTTAVLSANGRYVAYVSDATGLPHPGNPAAPQRLQVYRLDLQTGAIRAESLTVNGFRPNGDVGDVAISATGRYVVYTSNSTNLEGARPRRYEPNVYLYDNQTHLTSLVSVGIDGAAANAACSAPSVSADGRYVTYSSGATNAVAGVANRKLIQSYLVDRQGPGNGTVRLSRGFLSPLASRSSTWSQVSADGSAVAFITDTLADAATSQSIRRYDITTGADELVSNAFGGRPGTFFVNPVATISADGRFVGYSMQQLYASFNWQPTQILRFDARTGISQVVLRASGSRERNEAVTGTYLSGDGHHVAFDSLFPPPGTTGGSSGQPDVYEWNQVAPH